jgi:2,5-diketo-D-gluconate reductase A
MAGPGSIQLRDGNSMPQLGFGTWQIPADRCAELVGEAIRVGYRSIDTAQGYANEAGVGEAIRRSGLSANSFFVTSKLRNGAHARDKALAAFDDTMRLLGLKKLDLFLIHWPVPDQDRYVEAWRTLIDLQREGRIRSIGVSNFDEEHLERIMGETGVTPVVNQIELHPRLQQRQTRAYHAAHGIVIESWSPLGPGGNNAEFWKRFELGKGGSLLADPVLAGIARKHGKTPAQVIIRWHLDQGLVLFPKSVQPARIAENWDVFDFRLDAEDMKAIAGFDHPDGRIGPSPADFELLF